VSRIGTKKVKAPVEMAISKTIAPKKHREEEEFTLMLTQNLLKKLEIA
jgi:hypothetical protein